MLITLVRHGRTVANAGGLLQGRIDNPLDDVGRRQARAAAAMIGPVDAVITSPLVRAAETAAAFVSAADVVTDERWLELDYGDWDGRPVADVSADSWSRWRKDLSFRPPGGESLDELGGRIRGALEDLVAAPPGDHVVVVTHVSPIKAAVAWALGVGDEIGWRTYLDTGSITRLRVEGRRALTAFNVVPAVEAVDEPEASA
jgi:broad specificity phosphatase PhoE